VITVAVIQNNSIQIHHTQITRFIFLDQFGSKGEELSKNIYQCYKITLTIFGGIRFQKIPYVV
jgi:hypothetical protein